MIYLLDIDKKMTEAWEKQFHTKKNVIVVNSDFKDFMHKHPEIDALVSPGNSFGIMNGGLDLAIVDYFGKDLQTAVQKKIMELYLGEQPVGTSFSLPIPGAEKCHLIHTPTMRSPEVILDPRLVYSCMRTALIEAQKNNYQDIIIPAFGHCTGGVPEAVVAYLMELGYVSIMNKNIDLHEPLTWENVDLSINQVLSNFYW